MDVATKVRENRARRQAERLGYEIRKSRARLPQVDDLGGWRIEQPRPRGGPVVIQGERYDLALDDVERWLEERERELAALRNRIGGIHAS